MEEQPLEYVEFRVKDDTDEVIGMITVDKDAVNDTRTSSN
jgi:hypothetical protein